MNIVELNHHYALYLIKTPDGDALCHGVEGDRREDGKWDARMTLEFSPDPALSWNAGVVTGATVTIYPIYTIVGSLDALLADGWTPRPREDGDKFLRLDRVYNHEEDHQLISAKL